MPIGDICTREVVSTLATANLAKAACLMRDMHVGCLVVVDPSNPLKPLGIITDRDIVTKVVAGGVDAKTVTAGEVVGGRELHSVREKDSTATALRTMRRAGVRRLPVLSDAAELCGIVCLDDFIEAESSAVDDLVAAMAGERMRERSHAR